MQLPFGIAPSILDTIFRIGKLRFWLLLIFLCSNYSVVTWFNQKASLNSFNSVLGTFYCILWYAVSCALKKTKKLHISFTILRAWRHIMCVYMWSSLLFSFFFTISFFLLVLARSNKKSEYETAHRHIVQPLFQTMWTESPKDKIYPQRKRIFIKISAVI